MNTVAIIQARMGSTRLPGKMLLDIAGKPAVAHVVERAKAAARIDRVVLATTTASADDALAAWAATAGVPVFRGSEHDVLDRYYECAKANGADAVVRLTGDCPLLDPAVVDAVIACYWEAACDYVSNIHPPTYPDGLDTEVFSFAALERAWKEAKLPSEREHVTPYIWKHPELFRTKNYELRTTDKAAAVSTERWTLDTPEDLEFLRRVVAACQDFSFESVLAVLRAHPDWRDVNAKFVRNEGYEQSLLAES